MQTYIQLNERALLGIHYHAKSYGCWMEAELTVSLLVASLDIDVNKKCYYD